MHFEETSPGRPRVLVIDDSPLDQAVYKRTLRDFELTFEGSGEAGLDRLAAEEFDLVLLDFQLPRMNGGEVLSKIRRELKLDLPVVVVTGGGSESVAASLFRIGALDYVTKDDLHSPRVQAAALGAIERHWLDRARLRAEDELRSRKDELEAALRQLQEAQAQLVQSEKMAGLGQLVAGIAHEINNPVAYVANNLAVLSRDVRALAELMRGYRATLGEAIPEALREAERRLDLDYTLGNLERLLESSRHGVGRVRSIVDGLRDFARLDEAERKPIDPNEAVRATLEMVRYQMKLKDIRLIENAAPGGTLWCFAGRLNQMFLNIIMNSIQAVETGGTIVVSTEWNEAGDEVRFVIADDGPGIPESIRGRIFDPFFTTKPQGVGTGLGLWISYDIVEQHAGSITFETAEGRGTTFVITLPNKLPSDPA